MTDTTNLGLPYIEASQAQKHVTHNEALRILDAVIQVAVQDVTRTAPPASPAEGQRHIVAASPTGAWAGRAKNIATWQDGAWAFLVPKNGWFVWSIADSGLRVFDGTIWRGAGGDATALLGINTTASSPNLLSVRSNAALFAAINVADSGSGDMRVQISKESAAKTASVYFSNAYSGRAEFGLVGSDAFKLKVSADGSSFVEALTVDQASGNLALPRGLSLTGVISPPQITANQNDYAPTGIVAASVIQLSTDAARSVTGLAGGAEGRVVVLVNVGGQPLTLTDESASSTAANRFALGGDLLMTAKQAALLRYDATASRWRAIAGGTIAAVTYVGAQSLTAAQQAQARTNIGCGRLDSVTTQTFTSGSGTYVTPAGCTWMRVRLVGGGGGGGGSASGAGGGASGGATTFGALSGGGGANGGSTNGGAGSGGMASGGNVGNTTGGEGGRSTVIVPWPGGMGGGTPFGPGGATGAPAATGGAAAANTGAGGGGSGGYQTPNSGAGGGGGGYVEHIYASPAATYGYGIGAGGAGGAAGSGTGGGGAGGTGAAGIIIVEEHYD